MFVKGKSGNFTALDEKPLTTRPLSVMIFLGRTSPRSAERGARPGHKQGEIAMNSEHEHPHDHNHDRDHPHVHSHEHTTAVLHRISRVSGHLDAVKRMVEDGRDCSDVLIQLAAVRSAIDGISRIILKDHISHCIVDAVERNDREAIDELNRAIDRIL